MHLREFEGKELLRTYGIPTPRGVFAKEFDEVKGLRGRFVIKSQQIATNRKKAGGILFAHTPHQIQKAFTALAERDRLADGTAQGILIEEQVDAAMELYVSFSFDTSLRQPVLGLSRRGGSGITRAQITPLEAGHTLYPHMLRTALADSKIPSRYFQQLVPILEQLWKLFTEQHALLVEVNPLIIDTAGKFFAADAKITLDDAAQKKSEHRIVPLGGDIAVLASGGGASLLNLDALIAAGGKPANYTEYSGNPKSELVRNITTKVLSQAGLKGCWIVGGTANFTDIYETMRGVCEGLASLPGQITFPIVVRRDGPRMEEARVLLEEEKRKHSYDMEIFGREVSMAESARVMVEKAYRTR